MIDHAWLQVSYMAQIIVACLLFMIPVAKRRRFPARFASCTIVLLMIAYMFGAAVTVPDNLLLAILYWPAFAVICLPAVALCLQAGLSEVLYCTICANATQPTNAIWRSASHSDAQRRSAHAPQRTVDHGDLYRHLRRVLHHVCTQTRSAWTLSGESQ